MGFRAACPAACFCEGKNLPSQWRAYGKDGTGYALEFQLKSFMDTGRPEVRTLSGRIEYDEARRKGLVTQCASSCLLRYLEVPPVASSDGAPCSSQSLNSPSVWARRHSSKTALAMAKAGPAISGALQLKG